MKTGLNRQEQNKFKRDVEAGMTLKECEKFYALTKKAARTWFSEFAPKGSGSTTTAKPTTTGKPKEK